MRTEFPGYFKPTAEQVDLIWRTGLIVFDTNALLNLYRYTESTRVDLLSAIRTFGDRVRIPYQVANEFCRNRVTVITEQRKAYRDVLTAIQNAKVTITQVIAKHDRKDGLLNSERLKGRLAECMQPLIAEVSRLQDQHPDLLAEDDFVLDELASLIEGHILPPRSAEDQVKDRKWAQARIDDGIPPGFRDKTKSDGGVGDALIWREIIELAKAEKLPVIFVSDDQKPDWVLEVEGRKLGALPALRQELFTESGQDFQHYNVQRFLSYLKKTEKPDMLDASIEEAATVRDRINKLDKNLGDIEAAPTARELLDILTQNSVRTWALIADSNGRVLSNFERLTEQLEAVGHEIRRCERWLGQTTDEAEARELTAKLDAALARQLELRTNMGLAYRRFSERAQPESEN
ncbi:PIN domain-containing protein [Burkholderia orbicola]|uniref:PIN domain-containing protein n=1 Tax=Burkholderia orbicola TaxID=2978683 RepID=UPI0035C77636